MIGINYYKNYSSINLVTTDNNQFKIISDYNEFAAFISRYSINIQKYHRDRFALGDKFACLFDEKNLLSYGWICNRDTFYISEIYITVSNLNTTMLYDFYTPIQMRNQGFYTKLLSKIAEKHPDTQLAIFSRKNNKPSIRAIEKVGFKKSRYVKIQ